VSIAITEPVARRVLVSPASGATFTDDEIAGLDEPVQRYFRAAIAPGTPLHRSVRLGMRGRIRLGLWLPFRACQVLAPLSGFVWRARVAGVITGEDRVIDGAGAMDWRLFGRWPVMQASGDDVTRSSAQRAAAEAIWVPTAVLPRYGATWAAAGDDHIIGRYGEGLRAVEVHHRIDVEGRLRSSTFSRWGDPERTGAFGSHSFGSTAEAWRTIAGLTVPSRGSAGWFPGTERWVTGEFFRYRLTDLVVDAGAAPRHPGAAV
jgi:hypothetical protein